MDVFAGLFGPRTSLYGWGDARALTPYEIQKRAIKDYEAMRQATLDPSYWQLFRNYVPPDPRPLDDRFADFKIRLAAALNKYGKTSL